MSKAATLLGHITDSAKNNSLVKITLGGKRNKGAELKNVFIKPVKIREELMLSFVYRNPTNDITKNFSIEEGTALIGKMLNDEFLNADIFTSSSVYYYSVDKTGKEKLSTKQVSLNAPVLNHDKEKNRLIDSSAYYLHALGITSKEGKPLKEMQHKFRQINRYAEIVDGIIKNEKPGRLNIADMGSGKGYLTFALYDHLHKEHADLHITGIELRQELVDKCNRIAKESKYNRLHFQKGSIAETELKDIDMLIALHACDTATDDAIAKGIKADAKFIICAPCCHKQIRKQMKPDNALGGITHHGILLERQAEIVTDTIRSLLLEASGYKTKIFEFIDEEDTPKNVMIAAVKAIVSEESRKKSLEKVKELKELFGIVEHYLETIL